MATDITVILANRPGTLADLGEALGDAGINMTGLCGFPCNGDGVVHVVVSGGDAAAAREALIDAGHTIRFERDVLVLEVDDRPGAVGELTRRIADAGVNVDLVYLATNNRIVLGADDLDGMLAAI